MGDIFDYLNSFSEEVSKEYSSFIQRVVLYELLDYFEDSSKERDKVVLMARESLDFLVEAGWGLLPGIMENYVKFTGEEFDGDYEGHEIPKEYKTLKKIVPFLRDTIDYAILEFAGRKGRGEV